ncbi:tail fiber domain-containing protein [Emticicia sp. C21]|nr:tail fiber domain-containing protein [Emticicia sp. C21]
MTNGAGISKVMVSDNNGNGRWADTLSTKSIRLTNGAGWYKVMASDNNGNGRWTDTVSTKFLRMINGAGALKVMTSDETGNGIWTDPNFFKDAYWAINNSHLYQVPSVNLGIGTDNPNYKLDVRSSASPTVANFKGSETNGVGIRISSGVTGSIDETPISKEWQIFHSGTGIASENGGYGQLHFKDHEGTRMIIRNTGRVGIGVTNPSEMLEVDGNARINGRIDIRNTGLGVFIGEGAGKSDDLTSKYNTFVGFNSGSKTISGADNLAIGAGALENNITGNFNTALGRLALNTSASGTHNTALGAYAGGNSSGSFNVFLGYGAGENENTNDKLYIHNSNTTTPLIYGDFLNRNMGVNGRLIIGAHEPLESASKLDVLATANARFIVQSWTPANNGLVVARLLSSTSVAPQLRFERTGNNFVDVGQDTNGSFAVETGGDISRFVIKNTGEVGIGVTNPVAQFEIASTQKDLISALGSSTSGTWFHLTNSTSGGKGWRFISTGSGNTEGSGNLLIKEEGNSRMIIKNTSGAVGFGTINPGSQLEVVSTTNETLLANSSSVTGTWFSLKNTSTNGNTWKFVSLGNSNTEGAGHLLIKDAGGSKIIIKSNGAVGIGTEIPTKAKLVVDGNLSSSSSPYGYLNSSGSTGTASGTNTYSIYATHRIATSELNVYSDARIKKVKGLSDNAKDLEILKNIQITNYQLIDSISKGNTNYKKVIAQQVEESYPSAVTKMTDFIPDIYQLSSIEKGFIPLAKTTLKAGDKLKLMTEEKQEVVEVLSVFANGIQVNSEKSGKVFVYGKEVNDFRTVDYEALTTLNISATQQLLKRIEMLEKENQDIKQLRQDVESLKNILLVSQKGK